MLRKLTVLTLAAALFVGGADSAFAQRGGRGGMGGRGAVGGRSFSGGGRGWNGGGRGWDGNHNNGWGGFGTGLAIGAGLGYLGGYGYGGYGYGYPGYYGSSGYYADPGYYSSAPVYVDPGYTSGVVPSMSGATNSGYMAAYPQQNTAMINMRVPADAKVFFGNTEGSSAQTGTERHFVSPPLEPGSNYQYQLRAQWMQNGQMVDRTRTVDVHANQTVNVDFTQDQSH